MAKRFIGSADVMIDDDTGALLVKIVNLELKVDMVQTDVQAIVDGIAGGKTLAEVLTALAGAATAVGQAAIVSALGPQATAVGQQQIVGALAPQATAVGQAAIVAALGPQATAVGQQQILEALSIPALPATSAGLFLGNPIDGDTFSIGPTLFEFDDDEDYGPEAIPVTPGETASASRDNLVAVIAAGPVALAEAEGEFGYRLTWPVAGAIGNGVNVGTSVPETIQTAPFSGGLNAVTLRTLAVPAGTSAALSIALAGTAVIAAASGQECVRLHKIVGTMVGGGTYQLISVPTEGEPTPLTGEIGLTTEWGVRDQAAGPFDWIKSLPGAGLSITVSAGFEGYAVYSYGE